MINLEAMRIVAIENELALHESSTGVMLMEFPSIGKVLPLLLSADEGETWCPEASGPEVKMWGGRISLQGITLETEIRDMYRDLSLGSPDKMLKAANELQSMNGTIFS
ncbi:MAG: hypothetical protein M0023_11500 [Desulfobacteraceae bacterium]|nr:hypothetical protein [Desulfobacteraceae bacterium]